MRKLTLIAIAIVAFASMVFAQSTDEHNKVEFYGGFSHNRVDTGFGEREGFNGFNASITGNLNRYFGLKADVAGHFHKETIPISTARLDLESSIYNLLGGVQVKDNSKATRFKPFAHALFGVARGRNKGDFSADVCAAVSPSPCPVDFTETETSWAMAFGGGLDIRAGKRIDIRVIQLDYNPTGLFDSTQHSFRIGAGIVIH